MWIAADPGVNLYIAYYNSQRKGEAVHSPRACLPGGGWQLSDFDQRTPGRHQIDGRPLRVNRTLIALGGQRQLVYYWFQQRGRVITNEFVVKWYLFWDAITRHRTDGALVRLITAVTARQQCGGRRSPAGRSRRPDRAAADPLHTRTRGQMLFVLPFLLAMVVTMAWLPVLVRVAAQWRIVDQPGERKVHTVPIPRIGGIAMSPGLSWRRDRSAARSRRIAVF